MCLVAYRRSFSSRRAGICSSIIHTSFHELTNNSDLSIDSLVLFRSALYYSRCIRGRRSLALYNMYFEFARRRQRTFGTGWFALGRFVRRSPLFAVGNKRLYSPAIVPLRLVRYRKLFHFLFIGAAQSNARHRPLFCAVGGSAEMCQCTSEQACGH